MIVPPRLPGLAHGWEGAAWTELQQVRAGARRWSAARSRRLARRLGAVAGAAGDAGPAQMIGLGGAATVAAIATELDPALAASARRVIARWSATTCAPERDDLHLGHPGALLALAEIASSRARLAIPRGFARRCQERTHAALRRTLAGDGHLLGLAHGLAGLLLAAEVGAARLGLPRDHQLIARAFDRLAAARLIVPGIGAIWTPRTTDAPGAATGSWCHGVAGVALALHGCATVTGEPAYRELLDEATGALLALRAPGPSFCCGRAGRVQVLLELHRYRGDRCWLTAARRIAREPTHRHFSEAYPDGFAQGRLGARYAAVRLRDPRRLPLPGTGGY